MTNSEIADITVAMKVAREAFLRNNFTCTSLTACESDLRAVLGRINFHRGPTHFPYEVSEVARAVLDEVKRGNLLFVPTNEDLRMCVKAIQEDRQKRPAPHARQPRGENPYATVQQMLGKPPRMPQNLNLPSLLGEAQPFEYPPDALSDNVTELTARGVSEAQEAECLAEYERNLDLCAALGNAMGGARGVALCRQNAFDNYQQCRGF